MKILLVHNYYQIPGGEDTVVANEKALLESHGHQVFLYTRHNDELKRFSFFQKLFLPITTIYNPRTVREIRRIIRQQGIDIVHVHNTLNLISPSVYYAAVGCGVPVVQTVHNFRLLCPGATFYREGHICEDCVEKGLLCAVEHGCYRGSRLQTLACVLSARVHRMAGIYKKINFICLTAFNREKLLSLSGVKPEQIFVKPNFSSGDVTVLPVEQRSNRMIFVGRLDSQKGIPLLLQAWKLGGAEFPELLLCGTGPLEDWCRAYIGENGLANVRMLGFVPNAQARKLLGESRAMLLPTQWYEGFPMSVTEAFASGTPVITGDMGNAGSLVEDGVSGVKYRYDSPEALADAVRRFLGEQNHDWAEATRKQYDRELTAEENYARLMAIYNSVTS